MIKGTQISWISQMSPLTSKGMARVIVSLADSAEIADLESLDKGRISLGIPKGDALLPTGRKNAGIKMAHRSHRSHRFF